MSDPVIRVESLSKRYSLRHQQPERYTSLRDILTHRTQSLFKRLNPLTSQPPTRNPQPPTHEDFWALRDISFEVNAGDRIGIIGRNGAGKSTLLKILSRITEPTQGSIRIKGRVASLLEVGTGFHPELTGRENIYLNGAILGMSKVEIRRKFDEIVAFAEVDRFLDTPVKRYSSGMYVRLAFAVAAHLEPEILIVDEVLAVGDAAFQKKCLGKMGEVAEQEGRTILFVSHNIAAVSNLCSRAFLIQNGKLELQGKTSAVIQRYLSEDRIFTVDRYIELLHNPNRKGKGEIKFSRLELLNENYELITSPCSGMKLILRLHFDLSVDRIFKNCRIGIALRNFEGINIVLSSEMICGDELLIEEGDYLDFVIPKFPLTRSDYLVALFFESNGVIQDWMTDEIKISVEDGDYYGNGKPYPVGYEGKSTLVDFSLRKNVHAHAVTK